MKLTQTELQRLLELVLDANMHQQSLELHEKLLSKLSVEFAKKTIEKDPIVDKESMEYILEQEDEFDFCTSTARTTKLLKVTESDLRVLRNTGELKRGIHYETKRNPRPTAMWYDLNQTCLYLHEVTWEEFSKPGFDVQANTDRKIARAFERARQGAKK